MEAHKCIKRQAASRNDYWGNQILITESCKTFPSTTTSNRLLSWKEEMQRNIWPPQSLYDSHLLCKILHKNFNISSTTVEIVQDVTSLSYWLTCNCGNSCNGAKSPETRLEIRKKITFVKTMNEPADRNF